MSAAERPRNAAVTAPGIRPLQERVVAVVEMREGAYTTQVADHLQVSVAQAYGALNRAASAGRLFRGSGFGNAETFWMLPDA